MAEVAPKQLSPARTPSKSSPGYHTRPLLGHIQSAEQLFGGPNASLTLLREEMPSKDHVLQAKTMGGYEKGNTLLQDSVAGGSPGKARRYGILGNASGTHLTGGRRLSGDSRDGGEEGGKTSRQRGLEQSGGRREGSRGNQEGGETGAEPLVMITFPDGNKMPVGEFSFCLGEFVSYSFWSAFAHE